MSQHADLRVRQTLPPLPPQPLSRTARAALLGLRLFLLAITAMALFTFLHGAPK
jgi:hypothetical protein